MPYLIDGHNLIPKISGISLRDVDDEIQLIKVLQDFCRRQNKRVEVYFDNAPSGTPRKQKYGLVTAYFIREGSTADAAILSRLRKIGRAARNWIVVTSDREISIAAGELGARVIGSDHFAQILFQAESASEAAPETDPNLSLNADSVEDWLKFFGLDRSEE